MPRVNHGPNSEFFSMGSVWILTENTHSTNTAMTRTELGNILPIVGAEGQLWAVSRPWPRINSGGKRAFVTFGSKLCSAGQGRISAMRLLCRHCISGFTDFSRYLADMAGIGATASAPNVNVGKTMRESGHLISQFFGIAVFQMSQAAQR